MCLELQYHPKLPGSLWKNSEMFCYFVGLRVLGEEDAFPEGIVAIKTNSELYTLATFSPIVLADPSSMATEQKKGNSFPGSGQKHMDYLVHVPDAPLPTQFPLNGSGMWQKMAQVVGFLPSTWETRMKLPDSFAWPARALQPSVE